VVPEMISIDPNQVKLIYRRELLVEATQIRESGEVDRSKAVKQRR
jgi:hypothetical protein